MARPFKRSESWHDAFSESRGPGGFETKELATKSLYIQSKKFYIDVKENRRGKFIKISEVAVNGNRTRIAMDITTAKEFHERLTEFCEHYSSLGPAKWDGSRIMDEGKLRSESIFREDRRYFMDLRENHRGRFLQVSMMLPTHERTMVVVPAQGMIDVRDAMTDILAEFGKEDNASASKSESETSISFDGKSIAFDLGENRRGPYVRISEISPNFRTAITVPSQSWEKFVQLVEKAMEKKPAATTAVEKKPAAATAKTTESTESTG